MKRKNGMPPKWVRIAINLDLSFITYTKYKDKESHFLQRELEIWLSSIYIDKSI